MSVLATVGVHQVDMDVELVIIHRYVECVRSPL